MPKTTKLIYYPEKGHDLKNPSQKIPGYTPEPRTS